MRSGQQEVGVVVVWLLMAWLLLALPLSVALGTCIKAGLSWQTPAADGPQHPTAVAPAEPQTA